MARKKLSAAEQRMNRATKEWMEDHRNDTPCPRDEYAAMKWRARRGIGGSSWQCEMRRRYDAALAETHERRAAEQQQTDSASPQQ